MGIKYECLKRDRREQGAQQHLMYYITVGLRRRDKPVKHNCQTRTYRDYEEDGKGIKKDRWNP